MNYDDAFTIQEVEKEHVDILNHTAGMIPVIRQYIKDVRRTTNDDHHSLSYYSFVCREKKGVELSLEKQRQDLTRFHLLSPIYIYLYIYISIYKRHLFSSCCCRVCANLEPFKLRKENL